MLNPGDPRAKEHDCTCPDEAVQARMQGMMPESVDPDKTYAMVEEGCPMHGRSTWQDGSPGQSIH